jgi:hypothetical protein
MVTAPRLHWTRGRADEASGTSRTLEWIGCDDAGEPIARVVRVLGPLQAGWRTWRAIALDQDARIVELRPNPPDGADWLAYIGTQVVGRAALPLQAVRTAEAALA